jgi:hypothetical protein
VRHIAVLDRTMEDGAAAQPLHLDMTLHDAGPDYCDVQTSGAVHGLASKEFTRGIAKAVLDEPRTLHERRWRRRDAGQRAVGRCARWRRRCQWLRISFQLIIFITIISPYLQIYLHPALNWWSSSLIYKTLIPV